MLKYTIHLIKFSFIAYSVAILIPLEMPLLVNKDTFHRGLVINVILTIVFFYQLC